MTVLTRILVPLDGSALAESVLPTVGMLARCMGAEVVLLHIIEEHAPQKVHGQPHLRTTEDAISYIEEIKGRLGHDIAVSSHVHGTGEQDVAVSVAEHTGELRADMVALCTHGRGDFRRAVSGSIAQQVLRKVDIPVLLVRPQMQSPTKLNTV
ncbi:MAG: universal stress protein, partial [Chloroflexota bacterium]|nr:universal stress protein [Chloroflexota bacterium]